MAENKANQLARLVKRFDDDWTTVMTLAAGLSGLRNVPAPGDRYLAILWGAADALGQMLDASVEETSEAILIFLARYPDRGDVLVRMMKLAAHPSYREWVTMAGQSVCSHVSDRKEPKHAYGPLAVRYIEAGGG